MLSVQVESPERWILSPNRFTEYYEKSSWMCWTPAICATYILCPIVYLLASEYDPFYLIKDLSLWFVLQQGAFLQCYILLCSFVTMKWKHPTAHIAKTLFALTEIAISILTSSGAGPWSLFVVGGTFSMFVITLISAKLLRKVRKVDSVR